MPADQLEIAIDKREVDVYRVEMRFSSPDNEQETIHDGRVRIEVDALRAKQDDPVAYGKLLTASLFSHPEVRDGFVNARAEAQKGGRKLQVRVYVSSSSPELHGLRWELLREPPNPDRPDADEPLVMQDRYLFSRYLASAEWQRVQLRPRGDLTALVAVADPSDLGAWKPGRVPLAPVAVADELTAIAEGLKPIVPVALAGRGTVTLGGLCRKLREADFDIVCLVCHGALVDGKPKVWLEKDDGTADVVDGTALVAQLSEVGGRARLVVLVSCQSGGTGEPTSADGGALAALGPLFAEHGFPAVVAMQGNVTMTTARSFIGEFFRVLMEPKESGQIERAVAAGRSKVRDRADYWAPTLYLRLKGGTLWYVPGFVGEKKNDEILGPLLKYLDAGKCTPILGPGLLRGFIGETQEIARQWARDHSFPLALAVQEDLPQVAQYLAVRKDRPFAQLELSNKVRGELAGRFGLTIIGPKKPKTEDLFKQAVAARPAALEPFRVLAGFPVETYLTTTPDNLLELALLEAGRPPEHEYFRWNTFSPWPKPLDVRKPDYEASAEVPLVYHLYGALAVEDSTVLTEDDYFDYLLGVTRQEKSHPPTVNFRLVNSTLLFLGFNLDDWSFRVLLRSLMAKEGRNNPNAYKHVAVQVNPDENRMVNPERARRYLEALITSQVKMDIYWGSAEEFLADLKAHAAAPHIVATGEPS